MFWIVMEKHGGNAGMYLIVMWVNKVLLEVTLFQSYFNYPDCQLSIFYLPRGAKRHLIKTNG